MRDQERNKLQQRVHELQAAAERVIGLRIAIHDYHRILGPQTPWSYHRDPACMHIKADHQNRCASFDGNKVRRELAGQPDGRIHTCPFGHTEIAAPIICEGLLTGMVFAGPCWCGDGPPPRDGLIVPPDEQWLPDRLGLLAGLARQLATLMAGDSIEFPDERRQRILRYLDAHVDQPITMEGLAAELSLSPSRTRHVVREHFGQSLSQLAMSTRLREAAFLLTATTETIGEIARRVGIDDPNYFARRFRQEHGLAPRDYRSTRRLTP